LTLKYWVTYVLTKPILGKRSGDEAGPPTSLATALCELIGNPGSDQPRSSVAREFLGHCLGRGKLKGTKKAKAYAWANGPKGKRKNRGKNIKW